MLALVGAAITVPLAQARTWNQKTTLTFSGPVEIPGQVLPAGTYVFKLADSSSNRHIVQIFNDRQNKIFGTFLAIPDCRMKPAEKTIITFQERPEGQPPALKAWFYPGHTYGHEFVYPRAEAVSLARANETSVPVVETMPELKTATRLQILASNAAPIKAEDPFHSLHECPSITSTWFLVKNVVSAERCEFEGSDAIFIAPKLSQTVFQISGPFRCSARNPHHQTIARLLTESVQ